MNTSDRVTSSNTAPFLSTLCTVQCKFCRVV